MEEVKALSAKKNTQQGRRHEEYILNRLEEYMDLQVRQELVGDMEKIVCVLKGLDKAGDLRPRAPLVAAPPVGRSAAVLVRQHRPLSFGSTTVLQWEHHRTVTPPVAASRIS